MGHSQLADLNNLTPYVTGICSIIVVQLPYFLSLVFRALVLFLFYNPVTIQACFIGKIICMTFLL